MKRYVKCTSVHIYPHERGTYANISILQFKSMLQGHYVFLFYVGILKIDNTNR